MNQKGFTLLEILVVMALIAIIMLMTVPFTLSMIRKARAEGEIRNLYANLTEARQRAVQKSRPYIVEVTGSAASGAGTLGSAVTVYEDTDGDGTADAAEKVSTLSWAGQAGSPFYSLNGTVGGVDILGSTQNLTINVRGVLLPDASIRLVAASGDGAVNDAVVNCIAVSTTRVGLGKYDGTNCQVQ